MKEEYLSLETAQKLANYEKLEKELNVTKELAHYYKSELENVTRLFASKNKELAQAKKEIKKLKEKLEGRK